MFGKTRWRERRETEQKQKVQIQAWIREANEQRSVGKQQDKMEWMTRNLLKAICEKMCENTKKQKSRLLLYKKALVEKPGRLPIR